jgi:hypothetical protein
LFASPDQQLTEEYPKEWNQYRTVFGETYDSIQDQRNQLSQAENPNHQQSELLNKADNELDRNDRRLKDRVAGPVMILALVKHGISSALTGAVWGVLSFGSWKLFASGMARKS